MIGSLLVHFLWILGSLLARGCKFLVRDVFAAVSYNQHYPNDKAFLTTGNELIMKP